jgi:hypothetical protein
MNINQPATSHTGQLALCTKPDTLLSLAHIDIQDEVMHANQPASSPPNLTTLPTRVTAFVTLPRIGVSLT